MRRIGCFAVLTVLLLSHTAATAAEYPLVAPRPLAYWVGRLMDADPEIRRRAGSQIEFYALDFFAPRRQFDPDSIKKYSAFREEVTSLLPQLIHVLKNSDGASTAGVSRCNPVDAACLLIAVLGTDAKSAVPELKRLVRDKNINPLSRDACFYAMLHVTPETQPVGPLYIECLDASSTDPAHGEDEPHVPYPDFIGRISSFTDPLPHPFYSSVLLATGHTKCEVPFLVQVAEGKYKLADRVTAIEILGRFGFDGKDAVPALRRLLKDKEQLVRVWAADSLLSIEKDEKRIPEIVNALDLDREERTELETGFEEMILQQKAEREGWRETTGDNDFDKKLVKMIVGMMAKGSGFYRRQAIQTAGSIGPTAKDTIPQLRKALNDPDEETRRMAREALERIQR